MTIGTVTILFDLFICFRIPLTLLMYGCLHQFDLREYSKTIEEMAADYEDEKNSMIAMTEKDDMNLYDDFYEEFDNRVRVESSLDMIFFGPPSSFMRIDSETILHMLSNTKKHLIPITRAMLAWDIVTDGKTAAFLQGRELLAFSSLLNVVPEEDLYYVNFGDPSVLKYFSSHNVKLHKRKLGILVAAYRRYYGNNWYINSTYINELGYLLCGFPSSDLQRIPPQIFKELNTEVLSKLSRCDVNQTKTLYNIATHPEAYGEPYKWSSHEVNKLGSLFAYIPEEEISAIQLEALTALSPSVLKIMNQKKLDYFTKQQILRMSKKARRTYILRMQLKNSLDMSQIAKRSAVTNVLHDLLATSSVVTPLLYFDVLFDVN